MRVKQSQAAQGQHNLGVELNESQLVLPRLHTQFASMARKHPERICLRTDDGNMSYGSLSAKVHELANLLREEHGLASGSCRIGVLIPRSATLVASLIAVHEIGGTIVPFDPEFPVERHVTCAKVAKLDALVTLGSFKTASLRNNDRVRIEELRDRARKICEVCTSACKLIEVQDMVCDGQQESNVKTPSIFETVSQSSEVQTPLRSEHDGKSKAISHHDRSPAYILFTSGSTGIPKGVEYAHQGLVDAVVTHVDRLGLTKDDVLELSYSCSFDSFFCPFFGALISGASLVVYKPGGHVDGEYWAESILKHHITVVHTLPTLAVPSIRALDCKLKENPERRNALLVREFECMGENFPASLAESLYSVFPKLSARGCINGYGPTETFVVTHSFIKKGQSEITIGYPDPNVQCIVVDPSTLQPVGGGSKGELLVCGPRVALGYFNDPVRTAERFVLNPLYEEVRAIVGKHQASLFQIGYRTGDLVSWLPDGQLLLHGRADRQVKVSGVRVELGEIEAVVSSVAGVTGCAANVVTFRGRKMLLAWVTPASADVKAIQEACLNKLVKAAVPAHITKLDKFPSAPTGKVDFAALPLPDSWSLPKPGDTRYDSPLMALIAEEWKHVLEIEVNPGTDFFSVGGNSIFVMKLNAAVRGKLDLSLILPMNLVYNNRTLKEYTHAIENIQKSEVGASKHPKLKAVSWNDSRRPISSGQRQMWTLASFVGEEYAAAYNIAIAFKLTGSIDMMRLRKAVEGIFERHECLRTAFTVTTDGSLQGRIISWSVSSVLQEKSFQSTEELTRLLRTIMRHKFDMESEPLLSVHLLTQDGTSTSVLVLLAQHAVSDSWSMNLLCEELGSLYRGDSIESLKVQYADYVQWLSSLDLKGSLQYWLEELQDAPESLGLLSDFERSEKMTFEGKTLCFEDFISGDSVQRLSRDLSVTDTSVLLSGFLLLLGKWARQDDVVVGVPVAGRDIVEVHSIIGYFVNILPIRGKLNWRDSFSSFAKKIHNVLGSGMEHAKVPFSDIVLAKGAQSSSGQNPIFQVMFQYLENATPELNLGHGVLVSKIALPDSETSQVDLTFEIVSNGDGGLSLHAEYSTSLFTESKILDLVSSFSQVLAKCISKPNTALEDVSILTPDQELILQKFSMGARRWEYFNAPLPHQRFISHAQTHPNHPCLLYQGKVYSYQDVYACMRKIAVMLRDAHGSVAGKTVAVISGRSPELVIAMLTILSEGGIYLPIESSLPSERILGYLEDAKPVAVLMVEENPIIFADKDCEWRDLIVRIKISELENEMNTQQCSYDNLLGAQIGDMDPACILFTSGSTGRPKGVILSAAGLRDTVQGSYVDMLETTSSDVYALATSPAFDPHIANALAALSCGAALSIVPPGLESDALFVVSLCIKDGITVLDQAPSLIQLYAPELVKRKDEVRLAAVLFGGEALPRSIAAALQSIPSLEYGVYNTYGPTEFSVVATTALMEQGVPSAPIGGPDPNVQTVVVDPNDVSRMQPVGVIGELLLSGPRVALGYLNNQKESRQRFVKNPFRNGEADPGTFYEMAYKTGDLVSWDTRGQLHFHGRLDRQVKMHGVRIELSEIENILRKVPGVTAAVVLAVNGGNEKNLVGFVTPADSSEHLILEFCRSKLHPAAVPSRVVATDSLPLLNTGKVNLKALEKLAVESLSSKLIEKSWYVPPRTETEGIVAMEMQDLLKMEDEVSVEDNFFMLGGNSLKAGILSARLRMRFDIPQLPATIVYQHRTSRNIAQIVDHMLLRGEGDELNSNETMQHPSARLQADSKQQELLPSQIVHKTQMPYWLYLIVQYIMLSLTVVLVPVIWGSLLVALFELRKVVGSWWLIPLWPAMQVLALFGYMALTICLKWILVGKLKPGVYPVHGWMYARWVTMRAIQETAGSTFLPVLRRTPFMPLFLKLLGCKVEQISNTIIDSTDIYDFDLLSLGAGTCIYSNASITGAYVAPAGTLGRMPVLVLSEVTIGEHCHIGHRSAVTAGTRIPDYHNLKPHASRMHPGDAPVAGPLADYPHFTPEESQGAMISLAGGLITHFLDSLIEVPLVAVCLVIIYEILGDIELLSSGGGTTVAWRIVAFSSLFTALFGWLSGPLGMSLHALLVFAWKWTLVGRLRPGVNIASSSFKLFVYSIFRRLIDHPAWEELQEVLTGTVFMGWIYRGLGAKVGRHVFIGGLTIVEFDALEVGDLACSGSDSFAFAADHDGVIQKIILRREATIGNSAALYPGCTIGERSVVGNDTPICLGRELKDDARAQGSLEYSFMRGKTKKDVENSLELPDIVIKSKARVMEEDMHLPWWHPIVTIMVLVIVGPVAPILLWVPLAVVASLMKGLYWWLIPVIYVIMVGLGSVLAVLWLRMLIEVTGIRQYWREGSVSVFNISSQIVHSYFAISSARLDTFNGTPFAPLIYRMLGFRVGKGCILLGPQPLESSLIEIGEGSVVEANAKIDGHYMEFQKFIYHKVTLGKRCWAQEGSRIMPSTTMEDDARVMPASLVLPGNTILQRSIWCGLPAEPIGSKDDTFLQDKSGRRMLKRSSRIERRRTSGLGSGFLGNIASSRQKRSLGLGE